MNHLSGRRLALAVCLAICATLAAHGNSPAREPASPLAQKQGKVIDTPRPPFPLAARGRPFSVTVQVTWSAAGSVKEAKVVRSCGETDLDNYVAGFIRAHWYSHVGRELTHQITLNFVTRRS